MLCEKTGMDMDRALKESQKDKLHIKKYDFCFFNASGNSFTWKV